MSAGPDFDHVDALTNGPVRGRGSNLNPGNRFEDVRLHVLGEHLDEQLRDHPSGVQVRTQVFTDDTQSVVNKVESPDIPFNWSLNPYRGCEHGCIYCYARPGHEYLALSSGLDFETKIIAKPRAPELLRQFIAQPAWNGEPIVLSGVTDPYQPVERELRITRRCLEVCAGARQPISLITKNHLITRDLDVLGEMASWRGVRVAVSLTTLDAALAAKMEPRASVPRERLAAIRELVAAGVPVAVMTAPIIPAINDRELPALLEAAAEAGAQSAGMVLLKLPHQIKALFLEWLQRHFPDRAAHVESLIRQCRGGELYDAAFFNRQRGTGPLAATIRDTFSMFAKRHDLTRRLPALNSAAFVRPGQLALGAAGVKGAGRVGGRWARTANGRGAGSAAEGPGLFR
ncbi:MAG: PA0069 family radical SAM protein [Phycisphaerales bacterium]